jgi:hypothetical protein
MRVAYDEDKLLPGSDRDGWRLGLMGLPWPGPWPKRNGDLFVCAPNGDQAGIAWESGGPDITRISEPSDERWGVFQLRFPIEVLQPGDLIRNFHTVLPLLQREYAAYRSGRPAEP